MMKINLMEILLVQVGPTINMVAGINPKLMAKVKLLEEVAADNAGGMEETLLVQVGTTTINMVAGINRKLILKLKQLEEVEANKVVGMEESLQVQVGTRFRFVA